MGLAVWRDVSLLWLIALTLVSILPLAVLFFYSIKGLNRLRQLAQLYLPIAREWTRFVAGRTEEISLKVADPIIKMQAKAAQVDGVTKAIFTREKNT